MFVLHQPEASARESLADASGWCSTITHAKETNMQTTRWVRSAALVLTLAAAASAAAQGDVIYKEAQGLTVAYKRDGGMVKLENLALRPNVTQPVYLFYTNLVPGAPRKSIKIIVEQVGLDNRARVIGETTLENVKAKSVVPIPLTPGKLAAP